MSARLINRLVPAQLKKLEELWLDLQAGNRELNSLTWAMSLSERGPAVERQEIEIWHAHMMAETTGPHVNQRKTEFQIDKLKFEFYCRANPWPNAHDIIYLMYTTALSKTQITNWFEATRKKAQVEQDLVDNSRALSDTPATIWRAHREDPEAYTDFVIEERRLLEEQEKRDEAWEDEIYRHRERLMQIDPVRAGEMEDRLADTRRAEALRAYREEQTRLAEEDARLSRLNLFERMTEERRLFMADRMRR